MLKKIILIFILSHHSLNIAKSFSDHINFLKNNYQKITTITSFLGITCSVYYAIKTNKLKNEIKEYINENKQIENDQKIIKDITLNIIEIEKYIQNNYIIRKIDEIKYFDINHFIENINSTDEKIELSELYKDLKKNYNNIISYKETLDIKYIEWENSDKRKIYIEKTTELFNSLEKLKNSLELILNNIEKYYNIIDLTIEINKIKSIYKKEIELKEKEYEKLNSYVKLRYNKEKDYFPYTLYSNDLSNNIYKINKIIEKLEQQDQINNHSFISDTVNLAKDLINKLNNINLFIISSNNYSIEKAQIPQFEIEMKKVTAKIELQKTKLENRKKELVLQIEKEENLKKILKQKELELYNTQLELITKNNIAKAEQEKLKSENYIKSEIEKEKKKLDKYLEQLNKDIKNYKKYIEKLENKISSLKNIENNLESILNKQYPINQEYIDKDLLNFIEDIRLIIYNNCCFINDIIKS